MTKQETVKPTIRCGCPSMDCLFCYRMRHDRPLSTTGCDCVCHIELCECTIHLIMRREREAASNIRIVRWLIVASLAGLVVALLYSALR